MKENPQKAVQAAYETYSDHQRYCAACDAQTGAQCPRGAQLWRHVAVAIRRAGGPARAKGGAA